jgi:hypothetical protein
MTEIYNGPPLDSEELQGLSGANREVLLELYKRRDALDKAIKEIEANHKRNKHRERTRINSSGNKTDFSGSATAGADLTQTEIPKPADVERK